MYCIRCYPAYREHNGIPIYGYVVDGDPNIYWSMRSY